jgi:predicted transcriptional regulator of viral defense system
MKFDVFIRKKISLFSTKEARSLGVSPQLLALYLKKGFVEKVSHGIYRLTENENQFLSETSLEAIITEKIKIIPKGVIGFKTALRLYGLGEVLSSEIDIIVPSDNVPKRQLEDVKLYPVPKNVHKISTKVINHIRVTSLERTLVDLMRREEMSFSELVSIYKEAQKKKIPVSLSKMKGLSKKLYAKKAMEIFLKVLL